MACQSLCHDINVILPPWADVHGYDKKFKAKSAMTKSIPIELNVGQG